mmetsp:Transcript_97962/g.285816  ORF Transcript_97962/g.285816 Transcript_97962/m.285816 type:complete len:374 (+) Transcript_97962:101-1222(+)
MFESASATLARAALLFAAIVLLAGAEEAGGLHDECPSPALEEAQDAEPDLVALLQSTLRLNYAKDSSNETIPPELQRVLPIFWVHVPKCGSSFINTLIHLPGACPALPENLYVAQTTFGGAFLRGFLRAYEPDDKCPGLTRIGPCTGHGGIGGASALSYEQNKGRYMIMLRQPEQRLISAYDDARGSASHWSPQHPDAIADPGSSWGGLMDFNGTMPSLPDFARNISGCAVRMLSRGGLVCGGHNGPPTEEEVALAKHRLGTGFSFVGLTDHWALSMCLFDAMFKVGCHPMQFDDARPGIDKLKGNDGYSMARLQGVVDHWDDRLYEEGVRIFNANMERFNVSESSCQPCWHQAGLSPADIQESAMYEDEGEE